MPDQGGEKTEQASPKKREDERKKGNIFQSKDVVTVASLIASFYIMRMFIMGFLNQAKMNYENQMARAVTLDRLTEYDLTNIFLEFARIIATTVLPAMILIGFVAILMTGAQTKFLFSRESIKFKLNRIDPLKGIQKLFSLRQLVELAKSIIKISVIIAILYNKVVAVIVEIPMIMDFDVMQAAIYTGKTIMSLLMSVGIAFAAIAALDFLYQRYEYEKGIKMTKQEVKDEYKQMEGNPEVKGARKQKQREFAQQRMMQSVKQADVVVRNPTHFAVALRYNIDEDDAPIVLAKGADHLAARIVKEAEKYDITTVEDPPLARGLYAAAEIEEIIPAEFFQPVAELLAWIYSTKKNKGGLKLQSTQPPGRPA